ncbi:hypothetical protein ACVNIS_16260 [Sphaerotilaceae bacterium SBD11-9]
MPRNPGSSKFNRLVWRISDRAPLGEWIDPNIPVAPPKKDLPEVSHGRWMRSSFDLLSGVDVDDGPNTVPDDLFDELFPQAAPPGDKRKSPSR